MQNTSNFTDNSKSLDLICMEVLLLIFPKQVPSMLEDSLSFNKYFGECSGMTAVGLSLL